MAKKRDKIKIKKLESFFLDDVLKDVEKRYKKDKIYKLSNKYKGDK